MKQSRRGFIQQAAIASSLIGSMSSLATEPASASSQLSPVRGADRLVLSASNAIVETSYGKIRGYTRNDVYTFKGVPYGASTAGKNRFMPPAKPEPWSDVRDTVGWGFACLQIHGQDWLHNLQHFVLDYEYGQMSEDCLNLNIWTQGINDSTKRPVMLWIHGGGFTNGSSFEMPPYYGENLCKRGDVVVVSVNHRLNALGYLNLATAGGTRYAQSGNVGILDLVAALEWIRDNISNFGGDPGSVTIWGQSGGGVKVNTLMAMPSAKGLFHKAIVQSGSMHLMSSPSESARVGEALAKQLDLDTNNIDKLQTLPYDQLMSSARAAMATLSAGSQGNANPGGFSLVAWQPTADGTLIAGAPFISDGPKWYAEIPLIVGCCLNETSPSAYNPALESLTDAELATEVTKTYAGKTDAIIAAYKKEYLWAKPIEILSMIESLRLGGAAFTQAAYKASAGTAPAYAYRFEWNPAVCDGRLRAFHTLDLAFCFDNTDRWDAATGGGERAAMLGARMSQAFVNFARSGNPNHEALPDWPAYDNIRKAVMLFNDVCSVKNNPDAESRRLIYGEA